MRIGHGHDVHRLVEGRPLILGGVTLDHPRGLLGHSDADVLAHALSDALLGAARLGDIGRLFPDDDPAYEGADSLVLLGEVMDRVRAAGLELEDCDCTVDCQAPRLAGTIPAMRANLARAMDVPVERVGLKATTTEHLGYVGREEGIAAWAVCLLRADGPCRP